jgi:hypothetical protein
MLEQKMRFWNGILAPALFDMMQHPFRTLGELFCVVSIFALGYAALVMFT